MFIYIIIPNIQRNFVYLYYHTLYTKKLCLSILNYLLYKEGLFIYIIYLLYEETLFIYLLYLLYKESLFIYIFIQINEENLYYLYYHVYYIRKLCLSKSLYLSMKKFYLSILLYLLHEETLFTYIIISNI